MDTSRSFTHLKTSRFVELVRSAGISPRVIFDVGAYTGEQSLELAAAFPDSRVFAFEADWELASQAYANCVKNPRITVLNIAISCRDGLATFYKAMGKNKECGSLLKPNGRYFEPMPSWAVTVCTFTLKTVIDELHIDPPCIMWMDVQGAELLAFAGMGPAVKSLKMLWTEVAYNAYYENQAKYETLMSLMDEFGFKKIEETVGIPEWFGDVCYEKKQPCTHHTPTAELAGTDLHTDPGELNQPLQPTS